MQQDAELEKLFPTNMSVKICIFSALIRNKRRL
jgi:hypothetical protein